MKISTFLLGIAFFGAGASGQIPRTTAQPNRVYASTRLQFRASVESATVKLERRS